MPRIASLALLAGIAACTSELPPAQHLYVVQYKAALNGADSAVISYMGASIVLAIPLAKTIVFQSPRSLADVQSIPDKWSVSGLDSLNQVVTVAVVFKAAPSDADLASVLTKAASTHVWGPLPSSPTLIETQFRLGTLNDLSSIRSVSEIDLEYPGPQQATN